MRTSLYRSACESVRSWGAAPPLQLVAASKRRSRGMPTQLVKAQQLHRLCGLQRAWPCALATKTRHLSQHSRVLQQTRDISTGSASSGHPSRSDQRHAAVGAWQSHSTRGRWPDAARAGPGRGRPLTPGELPQFAADRHGGAAARRTAPPPQLTAPRARGTRAETHHSCITTHGMAVCGCPLRTK